MQSSEFWSQKDLVSDFNFDKSLKELRELRSQLHHAADYCESTFLNAKEKKVAVENTKEYICRAVVTVVDHLGCVSENINGLISKTNAFSEADIRINCLKQRFLLSQQFVHNLALSRLRWREIIPRHHPRYLSAPNTETEKSDEDLRDSTNVASTKIIDKKVVFKIEDDMPLPLFAYTYSQKPALSKGETNSVLPVRDGFSILSKSPNPAFHFQETKKKLRSRRSLHGSDILSLIRRTKRTA
ncbi:ABI family [Parasponia andersonii]|uniref:ABI family n=1 Tax=Parasponia andersonii TaxID=3476 RepID=A0A2P5BP21_PARAD|nr:ABI family [Parasponia andersonii]